MTNNPKPISDEQISSVVRNAICVIVTIKNNLEDELTLLQQYYNETRSSDMPTSIPDDITFFNTSGALYRATIIWEFPPETNRHRNGNFGTRCCSVFSLIK